MLDFVGELKCKDIIYIYIYIFGPSLLDILPNGYVFSIACIEEERQKAFDRSSSDHLDMLTRLWNSLIQSESLPPNGDFSLLGFQNGLHPETDLR